MFRAKKDRYMLLKGAREDRIRDRFNALAAPVQDVIDGVTKLP